MRVFLTFLVLSLISFSSHAQHSHDHDHSSSFLDDIFDFLSIEGRTLEEFKAEQNTTESLLENALLAVGAAAPTYEEIQEALDILENDGIEAALDTLGVDAEGLTETQNTDFQNTFNTLSQERIDRTLPQKVADQLDTLAQGIVDGFDVKNLTLNDTFDTIQEKRQEHISQAVEELAKQYNLTEQQKAVLADELFSRTFYTSQQGIVDHMAKLLEEEARAEEENESSADTTNTQSNNEIDQNGQSSSSSNNQGSSNNGFSPNNNSSNKGKNNPFEKFMDQAQQQFFGDPTNFGLDGSQISKKEGGRVTKKGSYVYETNCETDNLKVIHGPITTNGKGLSVARKPSTSKCHDLTDDWIAWLNRKSTCFHHGYRAAHGVPPSGKDIKLEFGGMYANRNVNLGGGKQGGSKSRHSYSMAGDGAKITVGGKTFIYYNYVARKTPEDTRFFEAFENCWGVGFKDGMKCSTAPEPVSSMKMFAKKIMGVLRWKDNAAHADHYHLTVPFCNRQKPPGTATK